MENKTNRRLTVVFAALCAVCFAYLVIGFLSIPGYYERVTTLTIQVYEMPGANYPTNAGVTQSAAAHGLTLAQYAVEQIAFHCTIVLLNIVVAVLIVLRARRNWFAWYSAFFLIFMAGFAFYDETYVAHLLPLWISMAGTLFWPLIVLYFYLFPNGRPAPRQALWVIAPFVAFHFFVQSSGFLSIFPEFSVLSPFMENVIKPAQGIVYIVFLVVLVSQVYRYRRISTHAEQQQSKWFLLGLAFFIGLSMISESFGDKNPYRAEVGLLIFMFVPVSIGVAILRYRLWDIDLIIRRTLVYTILTAMLGLVYFGLVILLDGMLRSLVGGSGQVATVVSTLAVAALFTPLRHRVQELIDRRFYRRKYNAEQALAEFAAVVRNNADIHLVSDQLTRAIQETVQPEHASLWLKAPPENRAR